MVVFALSCFGILLFLWLSFGGASPLKAQGYRFKAQFDEAALLVDEADVRISGLNVGKVKGKELMREGGTLVTLEIDSQYAPVPADTRAILRQKTLLGQIYIELAPGSAGAAKVPDGGRLTRTNIEESVEIDEVISTFDPSTRRAWRGWVRELARAIEDGNADHLNDAFGNLPEFAGQGAELLRRLDAQELALRRLIRNSGIVFAALTRREGQLRDLIVNTNEFFDALASRNEALAETISIFPTFLDESRLTFARLERFARHADPLVRDLSPVALKLQPTLRDLGRTAPDLKRLFENLGPLIDESPDTLPHAARFLRGAEPVLEALHVWLPELNPFLSFLNYQQEQVSDFIMNGGATLNATIPGLPGEGARHYLRQYTVINSRGMGVAQTRPNYERALTYPSPNYLKRSRAFGMTESFDCDPVGGEEQPNSADGQPPCFIQPPSMWDGKQFPRLKSGEAPLRDKPDDNEGTKPAKVE